MARFGQFEKQLKQGRRGVKICRKNIQVIEDSIVGRRHKSVPAQIARRAEKIDCVRTHTHTHTHTNGAEAVHETGVMNTS